ncbi:26S proteasome non-ATPase regulatory subunit 10-like [Sycon ciliatum]|uniref:26S proteasome non-ATPase regulatory subunit 10-like n=1 Tax=Sycon ciliatum TaxID=27933 RepID=UPI0031F6AF78
MAAVNVSELLRYASEDKVKDLKAAIVKGGVLKKEIKLQEDARGDPLLAKLLRSACRRNATSVVKFLVNIVGRNVLNGAGEDERTPLHYATIGNKADCVLRLLHAGANPDQPDKRGKAPLHHAVARGHIDCMRHLLDTKANPNQPDKDERTPLYYATIGNKADCVLHLLQAGAHPDQPDERGKAPLHYAIEMGHIDCMRYLLDSNANPNQPDLSGKTPLHYTTDLGHMDLMQHLLLDREANPNLPDKNGDTPLDFAVKQNRQNVVKYLISYVLRKTTKDQCRTLLVQAYIKSGEGCLPVLQDGIMDCLVGVHISQEDMDAWTELLGRQSERQTWMLAQRAITIRKELPPPLLVSSGPML